MDGDSPKNLLVTGGGRGIGRAVCLLAARHGWSVAIHYRAKEAAAEEVLNQIQAHGGSGVIIAGDVSDADDVTRIFETATQRLGQLSGVVHSAGMVAPLSPLAEATTERLRKMIDVNVLGALLVARETARRLATDRGGQGGALVNISSVAATLGSPNEYVDYAASKGAVDTLTIGLAKELASRGVRVNAVRPGLIDTELHADSGMADRAFRLAGAVPMKRPGTAAEVAEAVVWLLSPASSYVTGACIDVAGGR